MNKEGEGDLMMLVTDMALTWHPEWKKILEVYDKDADKLKADFGHAFKKLTELGFNKKAKASL